VTAWLAVLLERFAVGGFSAAIFAEPAAAAGYPSGSTVIVRNFPSPEDDGPAPSKSDYSNRDEVALYAGDITYTRGAIEMVQAMGRLPAGTNARLTLVGRINSPGLEEEMSKLEGWSSVDFTGRVEYADLKAYWGRARIGLAVLHPTRQYLHSVPTKLFEYMAAGLPVIASDFDTWRPYVVPFDCGILVDPRDVDQIAEAIGSLLSDPDEAWSMGQRGRKAVEERFNWNSEGARLVALYNDLLGAPNPGAPTQAR
jgi:glycosyltransferase involved in cell wall biosynthesis